MTYRLGWSFISDQQKGLINAIHKLAPFVEHRICVRHVYCNWKKEFKGQVLKNMFWKAVRCTIEASLKQALDELKVENEAAYNDFLAREPIKFSSYLCQDLKERRA
eukprot:XP_015583270.1 uncharacterized protein LOC107262371 [Ricinus communis]